MNLKKLGNNETQLTVGMTEILFSYNTPVACYNHATHEAFKTEKYWSKTTSRHINNWFDLTKPKTKPQEFFDALVVEVK